MFDVAKGNCELKDVLLGRFSPATLETRIAVDPDSKIEEPEPPPKPPPKAPAAPASAPAAAPPAAAPPDAIDIEKMIAGFHQAARDYNSKTSWNSDESAR